MEDGAKSGLIQIEGKPDDLQAMAARLADHTISLARAASRPLDIAFDISTCPRYFILYFLGLCARGRIARTITFFYAEGSYAGGSKGYVATKGEWNTVIVPGFEGEYDPEGRSAFVVSVGFEGERYRSLVSRYEPDRVVLFLPKPGFNESYTRQARKACQPLIEEFKIPDNYILTAPAGDAIAAWQRLQSLPTEVRQNNLTFLSFGPKPHVVGMGLHAVTLDKVTIIYRRPEGYTRKEVKSTGVFWSYRIRNLAIP
jgi:hypothetical protein